MVKKKLTVSEALDDIQTANLQFKWLKGLILIFILPVFGFSLAIGGRHIIKTPEYAKIKDVQKEFVSKKDFYILFTIHTNSMEEMMSKVLEVTNPDNQEVLIAVQNIADRNKALIEILTDTNYKGIYSGHDTYDRIFSKMKVIQDQKIKDSTKCIKVK